IVSVQSVAFKSINANELKEKKHLIDCDLDSILVSGNYKLIHTKKINSDSDISFSGLLPVVTLDTMGKVLMQAFVNEEALYQSISSGYATYFSRSRNKVWLKGETSGNKQEMINIEFADSFFIYIVRQELASCHEGFYSCYYRQLLADGSLAQIDFDRKFLPEKVYG
ncbi:MAG TPA: phosphoribosyl-AMP cyclohydrolase, partial [Leptospiraceae bacterium]|nr:phosphoribosyl-AMP cyclohydrolase [Leptospiraceae bacterium]